MPYNTTGAGAVGVSQAESAFIAMIGSDDVKSNDVVDAAYKVTRDALALGSAHTRTLERFVGLHIPQVEVRYIYLYLSILILADRETVILGYRMIHTYNTGVGC